MDLEGSWMQNVYRSRIQTINKPLLSSIVTLDFSNNVENLVVQKSIWVSL